MVVCRKLYTDLPFAHRQHMHDGHCALIHGHNWSFEFTFGADRLDPNGFVVDFGKLGWLRDFLEELFDHTLVLNADDPHLEGLEEALGGGDHSPMFAKIVILPDVSCEGLAKYLFEKVNMQLAGFARGVRVQEVTVYEDQKNSATATAF